MKYETLKDEYARLWAAAYVHTKWRPVVDATAQKILSHKARYEHVSSITRVPWYVIGVIHQMEAGCNFGCHLHNGDPLAKRTVQVPANRPPNGTGPFKWEVSACDALLMKQLEKITDWSVERICYELERYNGWGYRKYHPTTLSPYLWSGTAHYARGKYVADGKWSSTAVSGQSGAVPLLMRLMDLDDTVKLGATVEVVAEPPAPVETTPETSKKATEVRLPWWSKVLGWLGIGTTAGTTVNTDTVPLPAVPQNVNETLGNLQSWQSIGDTAGQATSWLLVNPLLTIIVVGWIAGMIFLPKILEKMGWQQ